MAEKKRIQVQKHMPGGQLLILQTQNDESHNK
jgi:hypothetical protein